jgi:hypothetical protein
MDINDIETVIDSEEEKKITEIKGMLREILKNEFIIFIRDLCTSLKNNYSVNYSIKNTYTNVIIIKHKRTRQIIIRYIHTYTIIIHLIHIIHPILIKITHLLIITRLIINILYTHHPHKNTNIK